MHGHKKISRLIRPKKRSRLASGPSPISKIGQELDGDLALASNEWTSSNDEETPFTTSWAGRSGTDPALKTIREADRRKLTGIHGAAISLEQASFLGGLGIVST